MASKIRTLLNSIFGFSAKTRTNGKRRGYEGAGRGRTSHHWTTSSGTQDAEIYKAGHLLRTRSRDAVRNNPLAAKIVSSHASYFVGKGIIPRAKTGSPEQDAKINLLFEQFSKTCDVQGRYDFYGLAQLAARMLVQDGEVFSRRRWRRSSDNLPVPMQFEVLDSEFCDWHKNGERSGRPIVNGIEYDRIGRRRGYWMFAQHPNALSFTLKGGIESKFVKAEDVVHMFEPQTNQSRGVPWLSPVLNDLHDLRDYEVAENIRKKTEACMVGVVIPGDDDVDEDDPNIGIDEPEYGEDGRHSARMTDSEGHPLQRMEPGMFAVARGGRDVKFNTPAASAGIEAYIRTRLRTIAAGARIPYELMTGDFSQANFASGKLGLIDYKRFVESVQDNIIIFQYLQKQWEWFVEAARIAGKIPMNLEVDVEWQSPEFETIDRLDEARADLAEIRMGKRSPQEVIAKTGRNPETVLNEIDDWFSTVDKTKSGLVFDSDPRRVSSVGQAHQVNQSGETSDAG